MRYWHTTLVNHAKARNIFCDLTLDEFKEFAFSCNYINKHGLHGDAMTVDRIKVGQFPGYTKSNIQPLSRIENSQKRWLDYDWRTGDGKARRYIEPEVNKEDLPF